MKKLSKKQINALKELTELEIFNEFYLAGGTALVVKYGHRISEDFDFFVLPDKSPDFWQIAHIIPEKEILDLNRDTFIFIYKQVKFSLFLYPYPTLTEPEIDPRLRVFIASDEDIAAMKIIAIMQRGEKKDFFDLWYLINKNNWDIKFLINICKKKYGSDFSENIFIKSLIYFEDAEFTKINDINALWDNIKEFFLEYVKKLI